MRKRGQAETPINWVFVLVAGAIILLFFGMVIFRIQGTTEKQTQASLITNLNSIFSGTGLSSATSTLIEDLPEENIFFECQGYSLGELTGGYDQRLTFAPSVLSIQPLIVWTYAWDMPYFVSNFLYLSNPNIRYIFVYDKQNSQSRRLKTRIEPLLPKYLTKEFVTNVDSVQENGASATKFIFLDQEISALNPSFNNHKVNALRVNNNGILSFYAKEIGVNSFNLKSNPSSLYFDDASLLAAIVADDADYYDCMMSKAFDRYKQISYIVNQRVSSLQSELGHCQRWYSIAAEQLYNYLSAAGFQDRKSEKNFVTELQSLINQLKQNNRDLPLQSCPTIY